MMDVHFFDPAGELAIVERRLPHWSQAGAVCFITFRTHDSLPRDVVERFHTERRHWLRYHGINPKDPDWRVALGRLDAKLRSEFWRTFSARWHDALDAGLGSCELSDPHCSSIVADSLRRFAGDRYKLTDFVVMPNHVHLLAAFPTEERMLAQCESWKHFTATQINANLGRRGRFWQQDGFDHLVRSPEQFEQLRRYIAQNPSKAGLQTGAYRHFSK